MSRTPHIDSPTEEVVSIVNKLGLKEAARRYEMDPSNLWRWLKRNGYVLKRQYVRKGKTTQQFQTA